jgi:hypothetical protein
VNVLAQACINIGHQQFSSENPGGYALIIESAVVKRFLQVNQGLQTPNVAARLNTKPYNGLPPATAGHSPGLP